MTKDVIRYNGLLTAQQYLELDDISEVMENDHIVVLVEIVNIVMKDGSAEQEKLYRWFELPFDCTKEELLEKIKNL